MITLLTTKEPGSVSGVTSGFTKADLTQWRLDIRLPSPDFLQGRPDQGKILVQSIAHAIANKVAHHIQNPSKSKTGETYGKFCPVCGGTSVHERKCPNYQLKLRGFK